MKYILHLLVILALAGCSGYNLSYTERITKLDLPETRKDVDSYDNGEFVTVSHFRSTNKEIDRFLEAYDFSLGEDLKLSDFHSLAYLKEENQKEPEGFSPFFLTGHSETNSWLCIVDRNSNRIWSIVRYPDMAGDPPGPFYLPHEQRRKIREFKEGIQNQSVDTTPASAPR